jgi:hypothetical protein
VGIAAISVVWRVRSSAKMSDDMVHGRGGEPMERNT